jgi:hypothetical protein
VEQDNDPHPHVFWIFLFHWFCNKKSILSSLEFLNLSNYWILIKIYMQCIICVFNNQLLHYHSQNKNSNINKSSMWLSNFSFEHAKFSSFFSLFFHCHFLDYYLFIFEHLDFPLTCILH